jgi:hypothetical protein
MAENPDSAYRKLPSPKENVGKNTLRDVKTLDKFTSSSAKGAARGALNEATERAASRLVGRAGAAGMALDAGWEAGRAIDKATGIGKKMVNAVMGEPKYEGERVTLSKRDPAPDYGNEGRRTKTEAAPSRRAGTTSEWGGAWKDSGGVREGKNDNISDDTRAKARRYTDDN